MIELQAADLFCGAGGTSTGMVMAVEELQRELGEPIKLNLVAVNHWDVAIKTHSQNHSFAMHHCDSLKGVQPRDVIKGRCHLLVASPECTHHSNARGGKPMDDQSRSSGADVVRWIGELRPDMVIIENVREYRTWGPLNKQNRPIKSRRGEYFQSFLADIRALGYATEDRLINCADLGDPTTRTRLFIYCKRLEHGALEWPRQTHAKDPSKLLVEGLLKWRTARQDVIDWSDRGKSILNRKKMLSYNTWRRTFAGLRKFSYIDLEPWRDALYAMTAGTASPLRPARTLNGMGPGSVEEPYLVKLYGTSDAASAGAPVPTVSAQGGHIAVAVPYQIRTDCTGGKTAGVRSIDDPAATVVGSGGLGVVDPQAFMLGQNYVESRPAQPRSVDEPVPTVLAKGAIAKVQPELIQFNGTADARSVEEPIGTLTGKPRYGLADPQAFLVANFKERDGQTPRTHDVDQPAPTATHRGAGDLVVPETIGFISEFHGGPDADQRIKSVDEPLPTQTCEPRFGLATPEFMASAGGPEVAPRSVDDPAHTVLTRDHIGLAAPAIIGAGGPSGQGKPQSVEDPLGTVIGENHRALMDPHLIQVNHGTKPGDAVEGRAQTVDGPVPSVTTKNGHALVAVSPVVPGLPAPEDRLVADATLVYYVDEREPKQPPRRAILIVFANGVQVLLDILFRMLRPRELARAQSFPDDYVFIGKTGDIVKQIGNAVPVKTAKALCLTAFRQILRSILAPA